MIPIKPPIVQIALDFATIEEALAVAKIGVEAGVDWLEIGTPLIVSQGLAPIGQPAISAANPLEALRKFVREVKASYRPRTPQ